MFPPSFVVCGGSGDRGHAVWAMEYFSAMLAMSVPNIEMHIYGNGRHPGDALPDGFQDEWRADGSERDSLWHVAGSICRLVSAIWDFLQKPGVGDEGREGY